jgi:hypothetical protein
MIPPLSARVTFTYLFTFSHFTHITRKALVVQWLARCRYTPRRRWQQVSR